MTDEIRARETLRLNREAELSASRMLGEIQAVREHAQRVLAKWERWLREADR